VGLWCQFSGIKKRRNTQITNKALFHNGPSIRVCAITRDPTALRVTLYKQIRTS